MTRHPPVGSCRTVDEGTSDGSRVAERVVLHIGTMKSGTSFVQSALASNPAVLRAAGGRYLGETFGRQAKAVRDVLSRPGRPRRHQRWRALVREARRFEGDAGVISMEFLSFAQDSQLDPFLAPLADLRVEVVVTVRDQFRAIPAQWQTFTRNFGTDDWGTYLRRIDASGFGRSRRSRAAVTFRRAQDVVSILDRWSGDPRVATVTVVTLPPPETPRDELWRRFCQAARLPAEEAELDEVHENTSLGYASCDFLRRLNVHLDDVKPRFYRKAMRPIAREALAPLRESETRPELDRRGAELAADLNRRIHDAVNRGGHDLVGTLDDLPVPDRPDAPQQVVPPRPDDVRRAALGVRECAAAALDAAPGPAPDDLDELVAETARLLRKANRWGL
jgi:hypothetical protein